MRLVPNLKKQNKESPEYKKKILPQKSVVSPQFFFRKEVHPFITIYITLVFFAGSDALLSSVSHVQPVFSHSYRIVL